MNYRTVYLKNDNKLKKLIAEGEHERLDFKKTITKAEKIAKTICAFANGQGGRLLIGVDDYGKVSKINVEEEVFMLTVAAAEFCFPLPELSFYIHPTNENEVLEAYVSQGVHLPYAAKNGKGQWKIYVRERDKVTNMCKVSSESVTF